MRLFQACLGLAIAMALGNASTIPLTHPSEERHQIATLEDIPELPEGFSWRILERPIGNDTRISRFVETDAQPNQLHKRAFGVYCTGHAGAPPLVDDCHTLNTQIQNYQSTVLVNPGYCHEATYGTCLTYVCAKCRQVAVDTDTWHNFNLAIISHCVDNGETGYGDDKQEDEYEVGIEHSGDELPSYIC